MPDRRPALLANARRRVGAASALSALTLCLATAATGQEEASGHFEVLCYNVHGLPPAVTGDDTAARLRAIGPRLEAFDLVALQEDFLDDGHHHLVRSRTHRRAVRFSRPLPGRLFGSGLTLLARFPIRAQAARSFSTYHGLLGSGSDGFASKGFLMLRLELAPGVELDVYDTHLDAGGEPGDVRARAAQVDELIVAVRRRSCGRALLLLGDTNLKTTRSGDRPPLARLLDGLRLRCACRAVRATCCGRIDRILYRSGAGLELDCAGWGLAREFRDAHGLPLSDHTPVRATFRWRRGAL